MEEKDKKNDKSGGGAEEKNRFVREVAQKKYEYGFTTDVQTEIIDRGLNEDVVRLISAKKEEGTNQLSIIEISTASTSKGVFPNFDNCARILSA